MDDKEKIMVDDETLLSLASDLYKKLGGAGKKDARVVRALMVRIKDLKREKGE